ncbi:MAG: FHA domain-containing protein [Pseudomonadota bacterium]
MAKIIISRDAKAVQEVEIGAGRTTIGRHPQNDVVIGHQAVSSRHAAVTSIDGLATLEDLDSSNGTFVNGLRIGRKVLSDGDRVTIGNVQIDFIANGAPVAPTLVGSIEVLNGASAGKVLALSKPVTTLGSPGVLVVVISRQADGYFVAQVQGVAEAQVNGTALGRAPRRLADGDELELTGTRMRFAAQLG